LITCDDDVVDWRTISQIRTSIFQLHQTSHDAPDGVRARLLGVVAEVTPALGRDPVLRFSGLLEDTLPAGVVEDLLAVLREALSNVARHAHASSTEVDVDAGPAALTLQAVDDGVGVPDTGRRSGLDNLRRRAEHHGGTLTLTHRAPSGTRLCWTVPIRRADGPTSRPGRARSLEGDSVPVPGFTSGAATQQRSWFAVSRSSRPGLRCRGPGRPPPSPSDGRQPHERLAARRGDRRRRRVRRRPEVAIAGPAGRGGAAVDAARRA